MNRDCTVFVTGAKNVPISNISVSPADIRRRIQSLARGAYAEGMPYRDPHTAASCLRAIRDDIGSALEVSHTTPTKTGDEQHRKGLEKVLIALHRRETNRSQTANFGRIIDGYR